MAIDAPAVPHDRLDPVALKADFPILATVLPHGRSLVYLDNAATTQHPRPVIQTLVETYERYYANVHRGVHWLSEKSTALYQEAREKVQAFIGAARSEEVIFTSGATMSINLVAQSWGDARLKTGDEVLLTEMEHHSNLVPWHQLAQRRGVTLRFVPVTDDGRLDLEAFDRLLSSLTKLVAVTAVSNVLGTINPVPEIIRRAHAAGALVLVDGAQGVPHMTTDVQAWDADFLAFSGHKMLGPSGVGVLYGKSALLDAMPPFLGGGSMIDEVTLEGFTAAETPRKFEAGTPPIVPAIGLGAAIDYLNQVGLEAIHRHELELTAYAHEALAAVDGLRIFGPAVGEKAGIVGFALAGEHPHDIASRLDLHGVAIRAGHHCAKPLHRRLGVSATSRASFYFYNTRDDVDALVQGLQELKAAFASTGRRRRRSSS